MIIRIYFFFNKYNKLLNEKEIKIWEIKNWNGIKLEKKNIS